MSDKRQWYSFKNMDSGTPELFIYDDIDDWWGVSAQSVVDQIRDLDATDIDVRINCRGGMVFEGIAIYNALRLHKASIHVKIDGLAASIASVIAMAGDTVTMAENSMMMIHNPYGWASGDAEAMRKTADVMDKIADSIAVSYTGRTGKTIEEMKALMDDETWFTAAEALEIGLVDQVDEPIKAAACFDISMFNNAPENWGTFEKPEPENKEDDTPEETEQAPSETENNTLAITLAAVCHEAGYPEKIEAFLKANMTEEQIKNRLASFEEIKNLCAIAKQDDKAAGFIKDDKSTEEVKNALLKLMAKQDETTPTDNTLTPESQGFKTTKVVDTQAIYSKRNKA